MSLIHALCQQHWAIIPNALRIMTQIARRQNRPVEAVEAELGRKLDNSHDTYVRDGVAVISVIGPMFRHANLFSDVSGGTSYGLLARDLALALADEGVTAILLNIDSPGGEVNGCDEFADMIFKARGIKPIVAYVDGMACSAAYWIASACIRIVATQTAIVGSIGVVSSLTDTAAADEAEGIKELTIVSSHAPDKIHGYDGITDAAIDDLRKTLDALEAVFIGKVARNRDVAAKTVQSDFGRGGTFVAGSSVGDEPDGLGAGLVDSIGDFEGTLASLITKPAMNANPAQPNRRALNPKPPARVSAAGTPQSAEETDMPEMTDKLDAILKKLEEHGARLDALTANHVPAAADAVVPADVAQLLALAEATNVGEFRATIEGLRAAAANAHTATAELAGLKKVSDEREAAGILDGLVRAGKMQPGQKLALEASGDAYDLPYVKRYAATLTDGLVIARAPALQPPINPADPSTIQLTEGEKRIAAFLNESEESHLLAKRTNAAALQQQRPHQA